LASCFPIQSSVGDDAPLGLLFDLDMSIVRLRQQCGETDITLSLTGVDQSLPRRWAAP
jgi:PKHD-type hydroxylase